MSLKNCNFPDFCQVKLKTGEKRGENCCNKSATKNGRCGRHQQVSSTRSPPKVRSPVNVSSPVNVRSPVIARSPLKIKQEKVCDNSICQANLKSGKKCCNKSATKNARCGRHREVNVSSPQVRSPVIVSSPKVRSPSRSPPKVSSPKVKVCDNSICQANLKTGKKCCNKSATKNGRCGRHRVLGLPIQSPRQVKTPENVNSPAIARSPLKIKQEKVCDNSICQANLKTGKKCCNKSATKNARCGRHREVNVSSLVSSSRSPPKVSSPKVRSPPKVSSPKVRSPPKVSSPKVRSPPKVSSPKVKVCDNSDNFCQANLKTGKKCCNKSATKNARCGRHREVNVSSLVSSLVSSSRSPPKVKVCDNSINFCQANLKSGEKCCNKTTTGRCGRHREAPVEEVPKEKSEVLSEEYMREYADDLDWDLICIYQKLSEEFMDEFELFLNWRLISRKQKFGKSFIKTFKKKIDWAALSQNTESFTEKLVEKYHSKPWDWDRISYYQDLSEEFIEKYKNLIKWYNYAASHELTESFMETYIDYMHWYTVVKHQTLSEEFIEKHQDRFNGMDWSGISLFQKLTKQFVDRFPKKIRWERAVHKIL